MQIRPSRISYLGLWEKLHNPDFKGPEFEAFENAAGKHSFYLSPQKWIETTGLLVLFLSLETMEDCDFEAFDLISRKQKYG